MPPEFIVVGIVCCCIDILLLGGDNFEPVEPELLLLGLREVPIGLSSASCLCHVVPSNPTEFGAT